MSYFLSLVLHGKNKFPKEISAQIGSIVILSCEISIETSIQSWRKNNTFLSHGFEINKDISGHERFQIFNDQGLYNLKIYNLTEYDFNTYWCETQHDNHITTEETRLIHSGINTNIEHKE